MRTNAHGLELSFKPYSGGRKGGRWFKTTNGKAKYFGGGNSRSDRESYRLAVTKYREWTGAAATERKQQEDDSCVVALLDRMKAAGPGGMSAEEIRTALAGVTSWPAPALKALADAKERSGLVSDLKALPLEQLRTVRPVAGEATVSTVAGLLDLFVNDQKKRWKAGEHFDALRAKGQHVKAPKGEAITPARYASIMRDEKSFRVLVGADRWDRSEVNAARIGKKWRDAATVLYHDGVHQAGTFNERIKFLRQFFGWAETNHHLERLPRDKMMFGKVEYKGTAKVIPTDEIKKLWDGGSDLERVWILLALNCDYYAKDISDLSAAMVVGGYVDHTRAKTAVNVRYKLWSETAKRLRPFLTSGGSVFKTEDGTPLVHFRPSKKDADRLVRVDNVRNHFVRLCDDVGVPTGKDGYSFSNIRDTATTEVEKIDRAYTDMFCAHRDKRMAKFYVDGKHVDTKELDAIIGKLEAVFTSVWKT